MDSWQEEVAVVGSSLLSVMDRVVLELVPETEDVTIVTDNVSKSWSWMQSNMFCWIILLIICVQL